MKSIRANAGCGLNTPPGWENLDNSPSLLIQQNLILRAAFTIAERTLRRKIYTRFPDNVRRWDITKGLPYQNYSVKAIYSSHMLEHLPRDKADFVCRECYRVLITGGPTVGAPGAGE